jgi:hypothetical protein
MHKPFLTVHDEERGLISPLGCWSGVYFSEEIKYALTLGYTFEYIEAMEFDKVKPFVEFIPYIYKKRLESKTNPGLNLIYKLLMNSLYGRFGMKYENKSSVIGPEKLIHQAFLTKSNVTYRKINNMYLISYVNKAADVDILNALLEMKKINITKYNSLLNKKDFGRKNTPQIAASITAYARIHMHKLFMKAEGEIFYTDTDSIHTSCTYPPEYVSSTELGKLKLENIASEAIYLSPKMYFQKLLDGSHIYKAKGLTKQNIDAHQYEVLYKSPSFVSEFVHNFMRDFNTFSVHKKIVSFTHTGDFLKRQKVFNTDGQWIATEPLKINK